MSPGHVGPIEPILWLSLVGFAVGLILIFWRRKGPKR